MTAMTFLTETGVTVPAVNAEQMREIDRLATGETGPNLFQMMENAGRSLALTVIDRLGADWLDRPITVLAGTGGNGGGGICSARHLANRGADVTLVISDPERLGQVPAHQLAVFSATDGCVVQPWSMAESEQMPIPGGGGFGRHDAVDAGNAVVDVHRNLRDELALEAGEPEPCVPAYRL